MSTVHGVPRVRLDTLLAERGPWLTRSLLRIVAGALVLAVLLGYVLEWAFFSFLYAREHLQQVLMTYGLILVFEEVRSLLVGDEVHGVDIPPFLAGTLPLGDIIARTSAGSSA